MSWISSASASSLLLANLFCQKRSYKRNGLAFKKHYFSSKDCKCDENRNCKKVIKSKGLNKTVDKF